MRKDKIIQESELILNPDGSIYHLKIHPSDLADDVILVGDPGRVKMISNHFDKMVFQGQNREFVIHRILSGEKNYRDVNRYGHR